MVTKSVYRTNPPDCTEQLCILVQRFGPMGPSAVADLGGRVEHDDDVEHVNGNDCGG